MLICLNYNITVTHCYKSLSGHATTGIICQGQDNAISVVESHAIRSYYRMNNMVPLSTAKNSAARSFCPMTRLGIPFPPDDLPE